MANFNYRDIIFDDDFQLGHDELLSLTRNMDLVTLAIRNKYTNAIQIRIYRFDPDFWFRLNLKWSGDMTAYINIPRKNPVLGAEYQKIEVHTLMCEYSDEYVVTCIHRKQTASSMKQIPDSYIIGNFHLVSVVDNSITAIGRVMPQNTAKCNHAIYSFIPYGSEFYSVIGVLSEITAENEDTQRSNDLYLTRGSFKLQDILDHDKIKRCSVKYDPVCNINTLCSQTPDIKYCMLDKIDHDLVNGFNIININTEKGKCKITHNINEPNNAITLAKVHINSWRDDIYLASHGCNGFIKFNYEKNTIGTENTNINNLVIIVQHANGCKYPFQIINGWPDKYNLNTDFSYYQHTFKEFISENLLLLQSDMPNTKYKRMSTYMVFNLDYDALTATLITCIHTKQHDNSFVDNGIYGGLNNTVIMYKEGGNKQQKNKLKIPVPAHKLKILYPSSNRPGLDMLNDYLPFEMVELVNMYSTASPLAEFISDFS